MDRRGSAAASGRLNTGSDEPLRVEKADGRVITFNSPRPGMVTIERADSPDEVLTADAFVARENAPLN
jgi:hypothetical protein